MAAVEQRKKSDDWKDVDDWEDVPAGPSSAPTKAEPPAEPSRLQRAADFLMRTNPGMAAPMGLKDLVTGEGHTGDRLRSFASGMTLGAAPRIVSALESSRFGKAVDSATGTPEMAPEEMHAKYRQAVADHPVENFAGSMAVPLPGSGLKGAVGVAARVAGGAGLGAVSAGMDSPGPLDLNENRVRDMGSGALRGAAFTVGGEGLKAGGSALSRWLGKRAELAAWKATQGQPDISDIARKMGYQDEPAIRAAGREFLDQDLIPFGGRAADIAERAKKLQAQAGTAGTAVLQRAETSGRPFDALEALQSAEDSMRGNGLSPAAEDAATPAKKFLDQVARQDAQAPGSYLGARQLKTDAYRGINWDTEAPLAAELHRKATLGYRDSINEQVGKALGPEDQQALERANQLFGVGADAETLADRAARRQAGHTLGLGGLIARTGLGALSGSGAGAAAGHPGAGAGAGATAALLECLTKNRQASALARTADFGSKTVGAFAAQPLPQVGAAVGRSLPSGVSAKPTTFLEHMRQTLEQQKKDHFAEGTGGR